MTEQTVERLLKAGLAVVFLVLLGLGAYVLRAQHGLAPKRDSA
ncbi:MAG: hypothetical protein ACREKE_08215 [bacterium]